MEAITRELRGMGLEEIATARFRAYRDDLVRRLGRGPLDSDEIDRVGRREFGPRWGGVGRQGHRLRPGLFFVVNTAHAVSSPGSHWMAVYSDFAGHHHVYDSFARSGRAMLWKTMRANRWHEALDSDRSDAEQRSGSLCGHMALSWLLVLRDLGVDAAMTI